MTIPAGLLTLVAVILVLAFVARPFIIGAVDQSEQLTAKQTKTVASQRALLNAERNDIYRQLRELDEVFEAGKIDETDYHEQRYLLVARGVEVLQQLDRLPKTDRARLDSQAEALINAIAAEEHIDTERLCPNCSCQVGSQDRFCGQCGHPLQQQIDDDVPTPAKAT